MASRHYTETHSTDFMLGISSRSRFQAKKVFCLLHNVPTSFWDCPVSNQTLPRAVSPGVKLSKHEAHHSSPVSTDVYSECSYTISSLYAFVACKATNFPLHSGKATSGTMTGKCVSSNIVQWVSEVPDTVKAKSKL